MMQLSDTQRVILGQSPQRPDCLATPPAKLPPAPRVAVAQALLKAGLLGQVGEAAAWTTA